MKLTGKKRLTTIRCSQDIKDRVDVARVKTDDSENLMLCKAIDVYFPVLSEADKALLKVVREAAKNLKNNE